MRNGYLNFDGMIKAFFPFYIIFMNLSMRMSHGMSTDPDISTDITFIAVHDAQMRDRGAAVERMREVGIVFW